MEFCSKLVLKNVATEHGLSNVADYGGRSERDKLHR